MFYFGWPMHSGNGTESDIEMSHQMMSILGAFARGEPAVPTGESWPKAQPGMNSMIIDGPDGYSHLFLKFYYKFRLLYGREFQKTTHASLGRSHSKIPCKLKYKLYYITFKIQ